MMKNRQEADEPRGEAGQIYGILPVIESLRSGAVPIEKVMIADGKPHKRLTEIRTLAQKQGVPVQTVPRKALERNLPPDANHQGVMAIAAAAEYADADLLVDRLAERSDALCLVLDGITDPHNLGAILRTAECAGVKAVFIPERRSAGLNETVAKTSAGAVNFVDVARAPNINRLIERLKEAGFWVAGADGSAVTAHTEHDWSGKWAVVLGNEGEGIHRLTREKCDVLVSIPMYGRIDSLNVSVAAGVLLFEIIRQRSAS